MKQAGLFHSIHDCVDTAEQVARALEFRPPELSASSLPEDWRRAIDMEARTDPHELIKLQRETIQPFVDLAASIDASPETATSVAALLDQYLPTDPPAGPAIPDAAHPAAHAARAQRLANAHQCREPDKRPHWLRLRPDVVQAAMDATNIYGAEVTQRITHGHPVVGISDDFGIFQRKNRDRPTISRRELLAHRHEILQDCRRLALKEDKETAEAIFASFSKQCENGQMYGPFDLEHEFDALPAEFVAVRRFIVEQFSERDGKPFIKRRPVDNLARNGVNCCAAVRCPIELFHGDHFLLSALEIMRRAPAVADASRAFVFSVEDMAEAYRHLRIKSSHLRYGVCITMDPNSGRLVAGIMNCYAFGHELAVSNYVTFSMICQSLSRRLTFTPECGYFDDFGSCLRRDGAEDKISNLNSLRRALGATFEPAKSQFGTLVKYLGMMYKIMQKGIQVSVCPHRAQRLIALLEGYLSKNKMSNEEAGSLAGKLSFASSSAFGRCGRAMLGPIYRHAHKVHPGQNISKRLASALRWFVMALKTGVFSSFVPIHRTDRRAVMWTDASLEWYWCEKKRKYVERGRLGVCVRLPDGRLQYHWCWSENKGYSIQFYELEALQIGLKHFGKDLKNCFLLIFIDNTSAQGGLVKGYSRSRSCNEIISAIWLELAALSASSWVERVASSVNIADGPSRGVFDEVERLGFTAC